MASTLSDAQDALFAGDLRETGSLVLAARRELEAGGDPAWTTEAILRERVLIPFQPTLELLDELVDDPAAREDVRLALVLQDVGLSAADAPLTQVVEREQVLMEDEGGSPAAGPDRALGRVLRDDLNRQALVLLERETVRQCRETQETDGVNVDARTALDEQCEAAAHRRTLAEVGLRRKLPLVSLLAAEVALEGQRPRVAIAARQAPAAPPGAERLR